MIIYHKSNGNFGICNGFVSIILYICFFYSENVHFLNDIMRKIVLLFSSVILLLLLWLWFVPSAFYVRQALIHGTPDIDDYHFFENRIVKAGDPSAWRFDRGYVGRTVDESRFPGFADYQTVSFLVVKDSAIFAEQYWKKYNENKLSNSFSMAKSIVSLLVGCALTDGKIRSLDQPVSDFLPELTNLRDRNLTLRTLLTMSAATDWEEAHSSLFTVTTEAYYGRDLWGLMNRVKLKSEPGKYFEYQSGVTQLLAFVLQRAVGESISAYASRRLWTPIQAENDALWSLDSAGGMEKAYCCFNSDARDFARLGLLVLNKGKWNGKQLISPDYISSATGADFSLQRADNNCKNSIYGYQFWVLKYKGYTIPYMRGILGQYVFIIPSLNAVVVRLGEKRSSVYSEPNHCPDDVYVWLDAAFELLRK